VWFSIPDHQSTLDRFANHDSDFRAFIKDETERLSHIIRGANIQLD